MLAVWNAERQEYVVEYWQDAKLNPEHAGKPRLFASLTESQRNSLFLKDTIRTCFRALPWKEDNRSILVGVHPIRLLATRLLSATSSPNHLHRDGERFTWGFLLERDGVVGGENVIAPKKFANLHPTEIASGAIASGATTEFTLEQQFEGWVVDDERVSHHVNEIRIADGCDVGVRTILLVDFCVAIPRRSS